jgi:hypothetical protein
MKVTIEIEEAEYGKFSDIKLCYKNSANVDSKISLVFNQYVKVFDFTNDFRSVKFDFFLISAIVYGVDNLFNREIHSFDGWARELEVEFPVYNLSNWQGNENLLEQTLNFLTGDIWNITFSQNTERNYFFPKNGRWKRNIKSYEKGKIKSVSLFSGGLDSLIGVIDELEKLGIDEKMLFVSHFDYKSSGPNGDQSKLYNYLKEKYIDKIYWVQSKLALNRKNEIFENVKVENNYRSRSLFFIGLGCYLSTTDRLIIPENGTISINYPLTPSRVSSLSTRTTHPFVIDNIQKLLNNCGLGTVIENPYTFKTKGEMFINCTNQDVLNGIFKSSVSCGKRGRKQFNYDNRLAVHCGRCMPCIYRRAALNKARLDDQLDYGNFITNVNSLGKNDLPALFNFLNRNITLEQMKRDLLVNGSISLESLTEYSKMVLKSKDEVLQLFRDKGNQFVKSQLRQI